MTAIDLPNSPTVGETYVVGERGWVWDGSTWKSLGSAAVTGPTGPAGSNGATGPTGSSGIVSVSSPITNTGTSTSANLGIDESAIIISQSQVTNLETALTGKVNTVNGVVTTASTSSTVVRNITLSTSGPSGGSDGDVWLTYTA